jgi:hypothetical protein
MAKADFYPKSADARVLWHQVFAAQLPTYKTKYGIADPDIAQAVADALWIEWIVSGRNADRSHSQQGTNYFNDIAGNDPTKDQPEPWVSFDPGAAPSEPKPGIEYRTRGLAKQMKGHADYSEADGEAMGIEGADVTPDDPTGFTPDYTAKTLANYELEIKFKKLGMSALKFQFRYKGGDWQSAGFLVTSPGTLSIPPSTPGTGEQIELRAIYMDGNNEVGSYSDAKAAFIAP